MPSIIEQLKQRVRDALPVPGEYPAEPELSTMETLRKRIKDKNDFHKRRLEREKKFGSCPTVDFGCPEIRQDFYKACNQYRTVGYVEFGGLEFSPSYVEYILRYHARVFNDVPRTLFNPPQIVSANGDVDCTQVYEDGEEESSDQLSVGTVDAQEEGRLSAFAQYMVRRTAGEV